MSYAQKKKAIKQVDPLIVLTSVDRRIQVRELTKSMTFHE